MNIKNKISFLLITLTILLLTACKKHHKYPESTYKWGDPAKPSNCPFHGKITTNCPFHGKITTYSVNGIDSLDLLDKYLDKYNTEIAHVKDCFFEFQNANRNDYDLHFVPMVGGITYEFNASRKKIRVSFGPAYENHYHKNLFINSETDWDIVRLSKDDKPFKLRTTLSNGNIYEMQIR